jgi:hypothetical protein
VPGVALAEGENVITVTAADAAGNQTSQVLTVTYTLSREEPSPLPPMVVGEVSVDQNWKHVELGPDFTDPVVVANPPSINGNQPAVVRIRNVTASGFDIRVQEWDYLDDKHKLEDVGYLVMERGSHTLPDGTRIEAGRIVTNSTGAFQAFSFGQPFETAPVLIATISTVNETDAVVCRLRDVGTQGFGLTMQEQQANTQEHASETISYIAWEPSSGTFGARNFEVGRTPVAVSHKFYSISFSQGFDASPVFVADMQTANGMNPAGLRWKNKTAGGVEVQVDEEQSLNRETKHVPEAVGYMAFSR